MAREMLHIAFDDTDSRIGRCTTHLAFTVVEHLKKMGAEVMVAGPPTLIPTYIKEAFDVKVEYNLR